MSFYGNLWDGNRTHFIFDKIYNSRYEMELSAATDGVFAGRFVLVKYDREETHSELIEVYEHDGEYYMDSEHEHKIICATFNKVTKILSNEQYFVKNGIFYAVNDAEISSNKDYYVPVLSQGDTISNFITTYNNCSFVAYNTVLIKHGVVIPCFIKGVAPDANGTPSSDSWGEISGYNSVYECNKILDKTVYGTSSLYKYLHGNFDATVWQKTYLQDEEKYILIACLQTPFQTYSDFLVGGNFDEDTGCVTLTFETHESIGTTTILGGYIDQNGHLILEVDD